MADLYINPNIETDDDELADRAFEYLESQVDGWEPHGGNLDVWLIEAVALMGSMVAELAQDVPATIFKYYGTEVIGLPVESASNATGTTLWTLEAPALSGQVIPANHQLDVEGLTFLVANDTFLTEGATTVTVPIVSLDEGAVGNDLTGDPNVLDPLTFTVESVVMVGATSNGADEETDESYLNRLSRELQTMGPKLVLPEDVEIFARRIPDVSRALALDNYDPTANGGEGAYGVEKTVTVIAIQDNGDDLGDIAAGELEALLSQYREVNFRFFVRNPTRNTVDVSFTAVAYRGADLPSVEQGAEDAVTAYLDPARWGLPSTGDAQNWSNTTRVRFGEIYAVLNSVEGLDYVESVTINGVTNADFTLTGVAPITKAGEIVGTVTSPEEE